MGEGERETAYSRAVGLREETEKERERERVRERERKEHLRAR